MLNIRKSSHISRRDKGVVASYHLNFLSADIKLPQYFCKATVQKGIAHDFTQFVKEHSRDIIDINYDIWEDPDGKHRGYLNYHTAHGTSKIDDYANTIKEKGSISYLSFCEIRSDIYEYIKSFKELTR
tara:strand:- start:2298 stop:2681 length:384 start_codon:yes stop_codon:yes gene_type:complete